MRMALIRTLAGVLLLMIGLMPVRAAQAQGEPPPVMPVILADLSARTGQPVTLADLEDWRWSARTFDDNSLGCPQPGEQYDPRPTSGYRVIITFRGATYDYRVSRSGAIIILCPMGSIGPTATPDQTPAATPLPTILPPTPTPLGREVCPGALPSRLATGRSARAAERGMPNPIRSAPTTVSTIIGQVEPGQAVTIVGGPECGEGMVWWQVSAGMLVGWAAEGQNQVYWLEPQTETFSTLPAPTPGPSPTPRPRAQLALPAGRLVIAAPNAAQLAPFATVPVEQPSGAVAWSADGHTLAVAGQGGIWLFKAEALDAPPRLLRAGSSPVHDVAFSPDPADPRMVTAQDDGTIRLWDVATGGQIAVLGDRAAPAYTLAFSPDGRLLASGSGSAVVLWDAAISGPVGRFEGHTGSVRALAFSADGTLLASGGDDGSIRVWDLVSATPLAVLDGHTAAVLEVAFSPDATLLSSASEDGTVRLWDVAGTGSTVLDERADPVRALAFSASGDLLITGGGVPDGSGAVSGARLHLWDVAQQAPLGEVVLPGGAGSAVTDMLLADSGTVLAVITANSTHSVLHLLGTTGTG